MRNIKEGHGLSGGAEGSRTLDLLDAIHRYRPFLESSQVLDMTSVSEYIAVYKRVTIISSMRFVALLCSPIRSITPHPGDLLVTFWTV